jgi:polyvinyl alcohol dehydrogenase (cytochrome)
MRSSLRLPSILSLVALAACAQNTGVPAVPTQTAEGSAVFQAYCVTCHDGATDSRAPAPAQLRGTAPEAIVAALTGGAMRYQGLPLTGGERRAVAEYLSGRTFGAESVVDPNAGRCAAARPMRALGSGPEWNGWGPTLSNTHNQPVEAAGLTARDLPRLRVKWALGFHDATSSWAQPTIVGGRLFVGSQSGTVYSVDAESGCIVWTYVAEGSVRSAVSIGPSIGGGYLAHFSDQRGYAYALDAETGAEVWKVVAESHPLVRLTGSVALHDGRLYVPTSSYEEVGKGPDYACCTFRGSIVALDAATGRKIWNAYTVTEEPRVMGVRDDGVESWGPSGGAIWSAPTIDPERRAIYAGVGNTYSGDTQPATDAIVAFDMDTGRQRWVQQVTPDDVYGCRRGEANCPEPRGPDYDFGASPILVTRRDGKDMLVIGQKSGVGYALDPDDGGRIMWQYRAGEGGALGGIEWGVSADADNAYFPVADNGRPAPGGLHAVSLTTGERVWFAPPADPLLCGQGRGCTPAQSAAITVVDGAVFSGAFDGGLRAYSTATGEVLWTLDTNGDFETVNGVPAHGGSINGPAPVAVGGMLYVTSGDYRGRTGNLLLALGVE